MFDEDEVLGAINSLGLFSGMTKPQEMRREPDESMFTGDVENEDLAKPPEDIAPETKKEYNVLDDLKFDDI